MKKHNNKNNSLLLIFLLVTNSFCVVFVSGLGVISMNHNNNAGRRIIRISESVWRQAARDHKGRIRELLAPGLTPQSHVLNSGQKRRRNNNNDNNNNNSPSFTALDPKHPVYNFLIEYYGLKGTKGPRRLARWSPAPALWMNAQKDTYNSIEDLIHASNNINYDDDDDDDSSSGAHTTSAAVLLENACEADIGETLHLRGAILSPGGVMYDPGSFFGKGDASRQQEASRAATPYLWYRSILENTLAAEPVLHCHGLHEWAMQYHPEGAPEPPSAKYQSHLPLRVSRPVINEAVERKGVSCTHVDALRYFAPAAGPLNHHGAQLQRIDQVRLEQPACVHAQMDLLKMVLRLEPFCDPTLKQSVLDIALQARRLDIEASPYDVRKYGLRAIPVETEQGRKDYRKQQAALMKRAAPIRERLLREYNLLLQLAFDETTLLGAEDRPSAERFAKAEPAGQPWRKNLVKATTASHH